MEHKYRFKEFIGILSNTVGVSEVCTTTKKTVFPGKTPDLTFAEYSMPAYDQGKTPSIVKGSEIHSSRIKIDKPVLLVNKLNVRKKRIWNVEDPLKNAVCSGEFVPLVSNKITLAYLQYLFETEKVTSYFVGCSTGTSNSQKRILPEIINNLTIDLPSKEEQQKIADFLSSYDEKISIQRERVEALERRKKGLLQKVFRQEIRFKADDGSDYPKWENVQIKDILTIHHGKDYKHLHTGEIPVLGTSGIFEYVDKWLCNWACACIGRKGATLYRPHYMSTPFWCVDTLFYTKPKEHNDPKFQYYLFHTIDWLSYNESSGIPSLRASTIEQISIMKPSFLEQQKIANFFTAIDDQINIEKERLTTMETIKKGLLQGLFC